MNQASDGSWKIYDNNYRIISIEIPWKGIIFFAIAFNRISTRVARINAVLVSTKVNFDATQVDGRSSVSSRFTRVNCARRDG